MSARHPSICIARLGWALMLTLALLLGACSSGEPPKEGQWWRKDKQPQSFADAQRAKANQYQSGEALPTADAAGYARIHAMDFSAVDKHALNAPDSVLDDYDKLAAYLSKGAKTELEKARIIFRWVTANIAYDTEAYFTGSYRNPYTTEADTLRSKKGVCDGYATVVNALARRMDIKSIKVIGYGKGYSYKQGGPVSPSNHAWNAMQVDGKWYLIDATWGAGYINDKKQYERKLKEFYFFPKPEQFIYSHLPDQDSHQLMGRPVPISEFKEMPFLKPGYFTSGLELQSHKQTRLEVDDRLTLTFGTKGDSRVLTTLLRENRKVQGDFVFSRSAGNTLTMEVRFPQSGNYELQIFTPQKDGTAGGSTKYQYALSYMIEVDDGTPNFKGFLSTYSNYGVDGEILTPVEGVLPIGKKVLFRVKAPKANKVAVVSDNKYHHLEKKPDGIFEGNAPVGKNIGVAIEKKPGNYSYIATYRGE